MSASTLCSAGSYKKDMASINLFRRQTLNRLILQFPLLRVPEYYGKYSDKLIKMHDVKGAPAVSQVIGKYQKSEWSFDYFLGQLIEKMDECNKLAMDPLA